MRRLGRTDGPVQPDPEVLLKERIRDLEEEAAVMGSRLQETADALIAMVQAIESGDEVPKELISDSRDVLGRSGYAP